MTTLDVSDVRPTMAETFQQVRAGLAAFSITSHPRQFAALAAYGLGRHGLTTTAALLGAALTWGDATALIDQDGPVTYRQLGAGAGAMAAQFAQAGVRPKDRVAILIEDDRRHLMAMAALELCGARIWLVNHRLGGDDLTALVASNDIGLVLKSAELPPARRPGRSARRHRTHRTRFRAGAAGRPGVPRHQRPRLGGR
ncbi:MAG: AMP-binding protein [Propionibacteriaceae bacterium]|nr:AMP-binding protein [Propionibacteriaceae bacterium]